ncbi:MAG: type II toxin-antitoxin system RelE/ParE family toxin [Parvibaculaceae bacterium]
MKVEWTREAIADRESIYNYIEADNPRAAFELDEQLSRRADQLAAHPMIGRVGRVPFTRELVVRPDYLLIYDIDGGTLRILRVLHAAQQWPPEKTRSL